MSYIKIKNMKSYIYAIILLAGFSTMMYIPSTYMHTVYAFGAFSCFWALMLMPMLVDGKEED